MFGVWRWCETMRKGEPVFELNGVCYSYARDRVALEDISLRVDSGDSVAVLGANGSGKSTLLKIMDGLIFPSSGTIRAFGRALSEGALELNRSEFARYFRRRVGMVFQDADSQLFCPVVREEVSFAPLQLGLSQEETERRVEDVLSLLRISDLKGRNPQALSEGEKRKVAIASVISANPDVLLLDEPSSDLDPRTRAWLREFLRELRCNGKTIVTATHDLELASETSERCVVLNEQHRIVGSGRTEEVLSDKGLLLEANLIYEHGDVAGAPLRSHPHA